VFALRRWRRCVEKQENQIYAREEISERIIGAAIEVHKFFGPGLVEQIYERIVVREFNFARAPVRAQKQVPIYYKGVKLACRLRLDLIVEGKSDCGFEKPKKK